MGVDLTLLFVDCGDEISLSQIECNRDYILHEKIKNEKPFERPQIILNSHMSKIPDGEMKGERCYGRTIITPYGEVITYLRVEQLLLAFRNWSFEDSPRSLRSGWNYSIMNFLESLCTHSGPDMFVALYWH